jgi:hypothetical protein
VAGSGGTINNIAASFDINTGVSSATGVTYSGFAGLAGTSANNTINGASAAWTISGAGAGSANGYSWTSFETINNTTPGATFTFTGAVPSGAGMKVTSPGATVFSSNFAVSLVATIGGTLNLTGTAATWELKTPSTVNGSSGSSGVTINGNPTGGTAAPDIYYNGGSLQGPTGGTLGTVISSVGGIIAEIAARALDEAFDTDSVAKQIKDGFVGDVGTTPPMDHRIDDTGISTPECFTESREGQGDCK